MADMVTKQELEAAKIDVKNAGEAVNEKKIVNPRYGAPFKSLPLAIEELNIKADEVIAQGFYTGYATETALKASLPTVSEMRARADDTRKIWRWNRTSAEGVVPVTGAWIDTGLSDLDQAKTYSNLTVDTVVQKQGFITQSTNIFDANDVTSGQILGVDGIVTANAASALTSYITVIPSEKYTISSITNTIEMVCGGNMYM